MRKYWPSPSTVILSLIIIVFYISGWSKTTDLLFLDGNFRLRQVISSFLNIEPDNKDIVIIGIDEKFISEYSYRISELDRLFYARVINNLKDAGVKVIALDMFFPESSQASSDIALAEAINNANVVLPQIRQSVKKLGDIDISEGFIEFNPLLNNVNRGIISLDESARYMQALVNYSSKQYPSFALAVLETANIKPKSNISEAFRLISYIGPEKSFQYYSFLDIYRNKFSYTELKDKIVLIGVTLKGTDRDQIISPFGEISGLEVEASQVYSLYKSNLRELNKFVYLFLLLASAFYWPQISRRKWGHRYLIWTVLAILLLSFIIFIAGLFVPPLALILIPIFSYIASSYSLLKKLDKELSQKITFTLDNAFHASPSDDIAKDLERGFAPKTYMADTKDMLESLVISLNASEGVLIFESSITKTKDYVSQDLIDFASEAFFSAKDSLANNRPYYLAKVIKEDEKVIGVLALNLPHKIPLELLKLLEASLDAFRQMAKYQNLRDRTTTFANTLWPWREQTSLDKINALAMLGDLLVTERSWLGTLLETLPQAVFIMSPYGYSIYKNAAAREIFGDNKNMLVAIPQYLTIDNNRFQESYIKMVELADELEFGLTERRSNHPLLINLKVVRDDDKVKGVAAIISKLNIVEELDRKRQEMTAMIAHDLRSPLTSIQGFTQVLLAEDKENEYLQIINDEAARMKRMTDVFLDLGRLESETFVLEPRLINLAEIVRNSAAIISTQAVQKNIILEVKALAQLNMMADSDLLSRLFINLLNNAIKFSAADSKIELSLKRDSKFAIVEIKDQGYGMDEQQVKGLFQKYKRVDEHRVGGTGLGLYVVKLIVDAHQGTIAVESKKGIGSSFTVKLPANFA